MPKQLSKKDIKEVFIESLEPFTRAIQFDFKKIDERFNKIDARFDKVDFGLNEIKTEVKEMKENTSELFVKLDKFISIYQRQEQELLILSAQFRRLEERVNKLETEKHANKK